MFKLLQRLPPSENRAPLNVFSVAADFPKDQQLVAAQAAILLLPDENREALRTLLLFLRDVVACVDQNQMTPTNIAVCLTPSLFHLNALRRDGDALRSAEPPPPESRDGVA